MCRNALKLDETQIMVRSSISSWVWNCECRESASITVTKYLLEEGARVYIYDPKVEVEQIMLWVTSWCLVFFQLESICFITVQCHASAVYAIIVCLSVTCRCSTETAKYRIRQTMPHDSPGTLVFWYQRSQQNSNRVSPQRKHQMQVG